MTYREIWHEIRINASPNEVYQAVTDVKKLAHWWTTETRGESAVGKKLEFGFYGQFTKEMVVTTLWVIFLLSLKEFVETGKGRPHPYDMPVGL